MTPTANDPIALADLATHAPTWPFSAWWTAKLIRDRKLACIRIGRRVFVTRALLDEFIQSRVIRP